eukprot:1257466-Rhodomonas_salina.1
MRDASVGAGARGSAGEASAWVSETSTRCKLTQALGGSLQLAITAGARTGTSTAAFSVDLPAVSSAVFANAASSGSLLLSLAGLNF